MDLIFAKWIFTVAAALQAGTGLEWPIMAVEVAAPARILTLVQQDQVVCVPGSAPCPAPPRHQLYCLERGVYTIDARVAMLPTRRAPADGRLWWVPSSAGGRQELLLEFSAESRTGTFQASSTSVAVESFGCFGLRYDSSAPARVDPDPRLTSLKIRG